MRLSILASLAFLALSTNAQDLTSLPECASTAAQSGIKSSGCGQTDLWCICKATAFLDGLQTIIRESCTADERKATVSFAVNLCNSVGVTLYPDNEKDEDQDVSTSNNGISPTETPTNTGFLITDASSTYETILTDSTTPTPIPYVYSTHPPPQPSSSSPSPSPSSSTPPLPSSPPKNTTTTTAPTATNNNNNNKTTTLHSNTPSPFAGTAAHSGTPAAAWLATALGAALIAWCGL